MLFTCIKSRFFRNHLANFHQISHWSFCWNVIDSLFKWSCSIDCQAHIFFFKTKNCSNDDIFISCNDRIGKMLHNICMSAVAMSLRWANRGPWASCFFFSFRSGHFIANPMSVIKFWCKNIHTLVQLEAKTELSNHCPRAQVEGVATRGGHIFYQFWFWLPWK